MNIKQCLNTKRNAIDSGKYRMGENFYTFASAVSPGIDCKICSVVDLNKEFYCHNNTHVLVDDFHAFIR